MEMSLVQVRGRNRTLLHQGNRAGALVSTQEVSGGWLGEASELARPTQEASMRVWGVNGSQ